MFLRFLNILFWIVCLRVLWNILIQIFILLKSWWIINYAKPFIARIAWHGWAEGDADHRLDVIHAWLLEEFPGNRLRILTQESQIGKPAVEMSGTNIMIDGHQSWLYGLIKAAQNKMKY